MESEIVAGVPAASVASAGSVASVASVATAPTTSAHRIDLASRLVALGRTLLQSGVVSWVLLVAVWWAASLFTKPEFLPGPLQVIAAAGELVERGVLVPDILISLRRVLIGWTRGMVIAIPIGLAIGRFKLFRSLFEPLTNFFRFVPAIGFLTLFLMWFGVGEESKLVLITYATVFPVIVNTAAGVARVDPVKYQAASSLGASSLQTFFTVTVPASIPSIVTGVRLGLSGAIVSIVAAEMLAANEGIGYLIYTSRLYYRTDWIFVGILVLGLLGFAADKGLRAVSHRVLRRYGVAER